MSAKAVEGSEAGKTKTSDNIDDYLTGTDDEESFDDFGQEPVDNLVAKDPPTQSGAYDKFSSALDTSGYKSALDSSVGYKPYSPKISSSSVQSGRHSSSYVPSRSSLYGDYEPLGHDTYSGLYGTGSRSLSARVADSLSSGYYPGYGSGSYGPGTYGYESQMGPRIGGSTLYTEGLEGYGTSPRLSSRSRQVMREGYDLSLSAGLNSSRQQNAGVAGLKAVYDVRTS